VPDLVLLPGLLVGVHATSARLDERREALKSAKGLTTFIKSRAGGVYTDKETGKKYQIRHGRAQGETRMSYALTESGD
jgi:hypothetical protein